MPSSEYKSFSRRLKDNYAAIVSTIALVVALTGTGAMASGLITGKQIKNGSITTADIKKDAVDSKLIDKNAVTSTDIKKSAVTSSDIKPDAVDAPAIAANAVTSEDIGNGEVQPEDITEPAPGQFVFGSATVEVGADYAKVATVGSYTKEDPTSILSVSWTGTANAPTQSCVFQVRVDGQPAPNNAGLVYVPNIGEESTTSVAVTALFPGLGAGPHAVEVWAKAYTGSGTDRCILGPAVAGIPQTFVVSEELT